MNDEINLPLRTKVLEMALRAEQNVTELLLTYLQVEKVSTKTLSNKTTSLSFKNKIDLLFDLDVLSGKENENLLLLMELRNQFMHNIHCNSFTKAISNLNGKENKLLAFDNLTFEADLEYKFENAYSALFLSCLDCILEKYALRKEKFAMKRKFIEYVSFLWETDASQFNKILEVCMPVKFDTVEMIELKKKVYAVVDDMTNSLNINSDLEKIFSKSIAEITPEYLSTFLKS